MGNLPVDLLKLFTTLCKNIPSVSRFEASNMSVHETVLII
jgi:hypothetical protein